MTDDRQDADGVPPTGYDVPPKSSRNPDMRCLILASQTMCRTVLDAVPVATYATDCAGRLTLFNAAATALWGRTPTLGDEQWCGSWRLYWPDGGPMGHDECPMAVALREDRAIRGAEAVAERPDGQRVYFSAYPTPLHDSAGALVGAINVLIDITERRNAEMALVAANADLERQVEQRTREREVALAQLLETRKTEAIAHLTAGVAHDFNNLLAAVLSNLELLHRSLDHEPRLLRLIDHALMGVERGAVLTERLLAFARRQDLTPAAVDIATLVAGMSEVLQGALGPQIHVRTDIPPTLPPAFVDPDQLELAILNLALNARDAMPQGGALTISARDAATHPAPAPTGLAGGAYLVVAVADTGVGMDAATLAYATEPFFTTKGLGCCSGLGLSMVQGLAAQSGGALRLDSTPGDGTVAELWLPCAVSAALPAKNRPAVVQAPSCRILFVDDDALVALGAEAVLEDLGHTVVTVASAKQALDVLNANIGIDLVITDYAMPGMTGVELAQAIRAHWPALPILLATGYADLPQGAEIGLPRLAKPYRRADLVTRLAEVLGSAGASNVVSFVAPHGG